MRTNADFIKLLSSNDVERRLARFNAEQYEKEQEFIKIAQEYVDELEPRQMMGEYHVELVEKSILRAAEIKLGKHPEFEYAVRLQRDFREAYKWTVGLGKRPKPKPVGFDWGAWAGEARLMFDGEYIQELQPIRVVERYGPAYINPNGIAVARGVQYEQR